MIELIHHLTTCIKEMSNSYTTYQYVYNITNYIKKITNKNLQVIIKQTRYAQETKDQRI